MPDVLAGSLFGAESYKAVPSDVDLNVRKLTYLR